MRFHLAKRAVVKHHPPERTETISAVEQRRIAENSSISFGVCVINANVFASALQASIHVLQNAKFDHLVGRNDCGQYAVLATP